MVTYTFPSGRQQLTLNNSATTVFDAVTNNPFFLSDWQTYRNTGQTGTSTTLAYPLRIDAAASNAVFNGGRFYGNIPRTVAWDNFYEGGRFTLSSTFPRFNSALIFPRNGVSLTINDPVFGIRNDLDSGYVDGLRTTQAGNITINRPRVWVGRDDWLEADGNNGRTWTINDGFFENQFLWLSATGNVPSTFFFINRSLVHFRPWRFRSNSVEEYGAPLKVDSVSTSAKFRFNATTLVIGPDDYTSKDRMKAALANTQATNGCRLLVLGGTHVDRQLIQAYQNAGFSVLEDGSGTSATEEWLNRKAAFLGEGGTLPPPGPTDPPSPPIAVPSLTSPCTFEVFAGDADLVDPILIGTEISATNSDVSSFNATNPAYSVGDLVLVFVMNDGGTDRVGTVSVTAPNSETVTQEQVPVSDGNAGTAGHTISAFSYISTANRTSGANIACAISGGSSAVEQFTVVVQVYAVGTFNPTTRLVNKSHTFSTAGTTDLVSAAFSAATANGRPIFVAARAFDPVTTTPSGWTQRANTDPGALPGYAATRDALTTSAESVAAATFVGGGNFAYTALTAVVSPALSVTNLLVGGRDLTDAAWTHTNATPTANTWTSPLGSGGDTLTSDGTSSETDQNYANWGTGAYNLSAYVNKGGSHRWVRMRMKAISVWFDVIDGTVGTNSGATSAQVIDAGTAWRIEIVGSPGTGGGTVRFNLVDADNSTTEVAAAAVQLDGILLTSGATLRDYPV